LRGHSGRHHDLRDVVVKRSLTTPVSENSILDRWVHLIVEVVDAEADLETLTDWARHSHMGAGTLREVCRAAGIRSKRSLDLARVLRAVVRLQGHPWMPEAVLNCRDPRTLRALLSRTGIVVNGASMAPDEFLARQTVLPQEGYHLFALGEALARNSGRNSGTSCVDQNLTDE
jgi:hypothetical protein